MTIDISNNVPRINYSVASGVTQTSFAVPFEFFDDSDLNVYVDGVLKTITSDYTVTGGAGSVGTITMSVTGGVSGSTVSITRDTTIERTTDFTPGIDINRAALNTQLDTLTAIAADNRDYAERAIRIEDLEVAPNLVLPSKADRANKIMMFDTEGGVAVASEASLGNILLGANYITDTFTGDGSTVEYTLTVAPGSKNNCNVHIDGVYQNKAGFSLNDTTLTFSEAPPLNASIEVVSGDAISEGATATAAAIDYNQGGAGAVDRNVKVKLQETVSVKDFGAVGDGVTDDTVAVQAALNQGGTIYFPSGTYIVEAGNGSGARTGIRPISNSNLVFEQGAIIQTKDITNGTYSTVYFLNVENITVENMTVVGDRVNPTSGGDQGHGIHLAGCTNIKFTGLTNVSDCYGDGVYVGKGTQVYCQNIHFDNLVSDNNRRQGVSVISVKGFTAEYMELTNTNGTTPAAGIDFEPNNTNEFIQDVVINNIRTENNATGVLIYLDELSGAATPANVSITINNHTDVGSRNGFEVGAYHGEGYGSIVVNNALWRNSQAAALKLRRWDYRGPHVEINNPSIVNANTANGVSSYYDSPIVFVRESGEYSGLIDYQGNVTINYPRFDWETGYTNTTGLYVAIKDDEATGDFKSLRLIGIPSRNVLGHYYLADDCELTFVSNAGTFDVSSATAIPPSASSARTYIHNASASGSVACTLSSSVNDNYAPGITFQVRADQRLYVHPPAGERLYPLEHYSSASGSGIWSRDVGTTITVKRIEGKWTVISIDAQAWTTV